MFVCLFIFKRVVIHCWWYDLHHSIHRWNTTIIPIKKYKRSLHGGNPVRVYCSSCFISLYIKKVRSCWNNKFRKKIWKLKKNRDVGSLLGACFDRQYCYITAENNCNDPCLPILLNGLIFFYCLILIRYKHQE